MPELPVPSSIVTLGFIALSLVMAIGFVAAIASTSGRGTASRAAALVAVWMAATGAAAAAGLLAVWAPPRMPAVLLGVAAFAVVAARAGWAVRLGTLPLWLLVGFQGFRLPVELLIHQAVVEGVASPVLTWTGWNFDIVTGISALVIAPFAARMPAIVLKVWNLGCAGILGLTIVTAVLAMPGPLQVIQTSPPNVWVATWPFVWLPAVLVTCAFVGHVVLHRRLRAA